MKCKICKNKIENLNLSIFHDCKNTFPYIFDINKEKEYYCYNPFKDIHMNKFYNQIEFEKEYDYYNSIIGISSTEYEGISLIESLLSTFFNYQFNNQADKFLFHNSSFNEEIAERLKKIIQNLHNPNLDEKIEKAIKEFILDIYYLILAMEHPYDFRYNLNEFIYIPNNTKIIDNLDQNYLLLEYNNNPSNENYYNNVILYSIKENKVLSSCYATKINKINNNNYIGFNKNKNLIHIEIKINPDKNMFNLEISPFIDTSGLIDLIDFNITDDYRLICFDKFANMHLFKEGNGQIIYKLKKFPKLIIIDNGQIIIDKDNGQFAILFVIEKKNVILNFYDFELNLKKNIELEDLYNSDHDLQSNNKKANFPTIKKFNKELYIIFGKRIYLISVKYLEVISILNYIKYDLNCKYFIFANSEEIFIKYKNKDKYKQYLYRYKLIKNELTLFKKYYFEDKLNDLKEIDNQGNYSILYLENNLWQEYYIRNNKNEEYLYPIFKEIKIKPISKRSKEIKKEVERNKYNWGENPKNKVRYYEKNNDNYYFEKALNQIKKKKRRSKREEEIEDKKDGEKEDENGEEKKEGEEEDIKREREKEFESKVLKDQDILKEEEKKEIKRTQESKQMTKVEKKEEDILLTNGPRNKRGKKKNFKEVDNKIKINFGIVGAGETKGRERRKRMPRHFHYNEEDFPVLK